MVSQTRNYQAYNGISVTQDDFRLDAGVYGVTLAAGVWGTVTLQRVYAQPPGAPVLIPVLPATVANGYSVIQLPAGQYRLTLAGVTTLTGAIELIAHGSG